MYRRVRDPRNTTNAGPRADGCGCGYQAPAPVRISEEAGCADPADGPGCP